MDTTYYTFQTRKIKVGNGADLVTFVPAAQPDPQTKAPAGEVLDFDLCRRRLETRTAWKELAAAAQTSWEDRDSDERYEAVSPAPASAPSRRESRRTYAPWAEICASALALGLVCLVGITALLHIV